MLLCCWRSLLQRHFCEGRRSPEPQGWDAVVGPAALKCSLPRATLSAQHRAPVCIGAEPCTRVSAARDAPGALETTDLPVLEWPSNKCQPLLRVLL